jgi:hypothetical protein
LRSTQDRRQHASKVRGARFGERDKSRRREFPAGGIGNRPDDEKRDAGLRGGAGDDVALEIHSESARVTPSAAFLFLGR